MSAEQRPIIQDLLDEVLESRGLSKDVAAEILSTSKATSTLHLRQALGRILEREANLKKKEAQRK